MNIIADMWRFAECAYHENFWTDKDPGSKAPELKGAIITPLINDLDSGFIADFEDRLIISFEGTKDTKAWIDDAKVFPLQSEYQTGEGTLCHGFYDGWVAFKSTITDYIKNNIKPGTPIFCTGHSRGGVLCVLCARHIAKNMKIPCSCVGFAGPAPGNSVARDEIDILPINLTRVVNHKDIVPTLPPYSLGFRQPGKLLQLAGKFNWFDSIRDHYQSEYTWSIQKWCKDRGDIESSKALDYIMARAKHPKSPFWPF